MAKANTIGSIFPSTGGQVWMDITRRALILAGGILVTAVASGTTSAHAEPPISTDEPACLYAGTYGSSSLCIRRDSFNADLCRAIGHFSEVHDVP
ncbi:MAG: hypothetical protein ACK4UZ_10820, partial [Rhizobium rhizophilum]